MQLQQKEVLDKLRDNFSLISSSILGINIFLKDDVLNVVFKINLCYSDTVIELHFANVKEYAFYHTDVHYFYNVETCKFLFKNEAFYISFDPFDDKNEIDPNDNDYVIAENVTLYL